MRPNSIKTILMAASVALASTAVAQTTTLTLDDAVRIALSDNPTVKVADSEITKQEYAKKGTLANLMPTLDFSAGYNRTLKKQVMYMGDMKGFGGGSSEGTEGAEGTEAASAMRDGIKVGMDNTWSAGFALSLPLVNAQLWKQLSISADDVELAVEKSRQSRISMVSQVKQAYYAVMLAEASRDALKENYDNAKKKYDDINQKYQQGLSSEYDLIRADVAVKNVEPSLFDAENSIVLAKWRLKALIGVDLDMSIDCTGSLNDYTDRLYDGYMKVDTTMLAQTHRCGKSTCSSGSCSSRATWRSPLIIRRSTCRSHTNGTRWQTISASRTIVGIRIQRSDCRSTSRFFPADAATTR